MTDRPIIFSAPMVRALIEGRKTQTRRVIKHKSIELGIAPRVKVDHPAWIQFLHPQGGPLTCVKWPYAPGDRLYVREHWRTACAYDDLAPSEMGGEEPVKYEADGTEQMWGWPDRFLPGRFRQGMHMPRWASRLTLTVSKVRVQRLQEISEEDALAEGCPAQTDDELAGYEARGWFRDLWNSLHGPDAWDANPWVVALTFSVARGNVDQLGVPA